MGHRSEKCGAKIDESAIFGSLPFWVCCAELVQKHASPCLSQTTLLFPVCLVMDSFYSATLCPSGSHVKCSEEKRGADFGLFVGGLHPGTVV